MQQLLVLDVPLPNQSAWVIYSPSGCHVFTPMQAVLHVAVASGSPAEQLAADRLLEAYCTRNAAGQGMLAGSLPTCWPLRCTCSSRCSSWGRSRVQQAA